MTPFVRVMRASSAVALGVGSAMAIAPAWANPVASDAVAEALAQTDPPQRVLPFTDVPANHWAYEALLNLAGTYGCLSGYPDGSFRGDATVTRFEFAAGLNACLGVLAGMAAQEAAAGDREVQSLIQSMERSLAELRQLGDELPEVP